MFIVHCSLGEAIVWGAIGLVVLACIVVALGCVIVEQTKRLFRWVRAEPFPAVCFAAFGAMAIYALAKCAWAIIQVIRG